MDLWITTFAEGAGPGVSGQRPREVEGAVLADQSTVALQRFELQAARVGHAGTGRSIALVRTQVASLVEKRMAA